MINVRRGVDFTVEFFRSFMWALAAFFITARLVSPEAGALLALAVFVTALTFIATSRVQERRARAIAEGACPRCGEALVTDHEHRRWDATDQKWLPALTTWHCPRCAFQQEAPLGCEACPAPV